MLLTIFRYTQILVAGSAKFATEECRSVGPVLLVYQFLTPPTNVPTLSVIHVRGECSELTKEFHSVERAAFDYSKKRCEGGASDSTQLSTLIRIPSMLCMGSIHTMGGRRRRC